MVFLLDFVVLIRLVTQVVGQLHQQVSFQGDGKAFRGSWLNKPKGSSSSGIMVGLSV
jgi:hypothetical protein